MWPMGLCTTGVQNETAEVQNELEARKVEIVCAELVSKSRSVQQSMGVQNGRRACPEW